MGGAYQGKRRYGGVNRTVRPRARGVARMSEATCGKALPRMSLPLIRATVAASAQLDVAAHFVREACLVERHGRLCTKRLVAGELALGYRLAHCFFDLALGGHPKHFQKFPDTGVQSVFVHARLHCAHRIAFERLLT